MSKRNPDVCPVCGSEDVARMIDNFRTEKEGVAEIIYACDERDCSSEWRGVYRCVSIVDVVDNRPPVDESDGWSTDDEPIPDGENTAWDLTEEGKEWNAAVEEHQSKPKTETKSEGWSTEPQDAWEEFANVKPPPKIAITM